jgi:hypothetical protein
VAELADPTDRRVSSRDPTARFVAIDLADVDRSTGEARPRSVLGAEVAGPRATFEEGDVLVSKLRPELGTVAIARRARGQEGPLVGSPEWLVLRPRGLGHFLMHALRTPAWRAELPATTGQTRPRISAEDVSASRVRWPGPAVAAEIERLATRLHAEAASVREALLALQDAMDRHAAGEIDDDALSRIAAEIDQRG